MKKLTKIGIILSAALFIAPHVFAFSMPWIDHTPRTAEQKLTELGEARYTALVSFFNADINHKRGRQDVLDERYVGTNNETEKSNANNKWATVNKDIAELDNCFSVLGKGCELKLVPVFQ